MKKFYLPLIAGAMALSFAACGGQKSANGRESVELTGAGATFPLPFYNFITFRINVDKLWIIPRIFRIPKILKLVYDLLRHFTLLCGNKLRIPFMIARKRCAGHIGASNNDMVHFILFKDISLGMEPIMRSFHVIHF